MEDRLLEYTETLPPYNSKSCPFLVDCFSCSQIQLQGLTRRRKYTDYRQAQCKNYSRTTDRAFFHHYHFSVEILFQICDGEAVNQESVYLQSELLVMGEAFKV